MSSLRLRNDTYHVCFRYGSRQYDRSLGTKNRSDARDALDRVQCTLQSMRYGHLRVPPGVDVGKFVVSGGVLVEPESSATSALTVADAIKSYVESQQDKVADSYLNAQQTHLRHLVAYLPLGAEQTLDAVTARHLEGFVEHRLRLRDPNTVVRERNTLQRFFNWLVGRGHLETSPAAQLETIKAGRDLPPFRTVAEIEAIIERGGLDDAEKNELWECLYLDPAEIAELLGTVRQRARCEESFMLHAIPAYTGIRRGEILRLRWTDVDLDAGFITARSRKQSRTKRETLRRIDLHPNLQAELERWREERPTGQYVVCDTDTLEPFEKDKANRFFWQPMRATKWCLDSKKNWFKLGFHTYRHSFASNLAAAGVDQRIIDEFMGHTTEAMRRRYRHLFPNNKRAAIEKLTYRSDLVENQEN